jgi:hypothetical protein
MLPQDRIYSEYKKGFDELQRPVGTKLISTYDAFGALEKTRIMYKEDFPQGCDYWVGQIREYAGSKESVRAFYTAQTVQFGGERKSPGVLFVPINANGVIDPDGMSDAEISGWGPMGFRLLEGLKDDQHSLNMEFPASYYYVGIGGFSQTDHDIRCQF